MSVHPFALYPAEPGNFETGRHHIGTAAPLVTPKGVRYETGDDAPVDLWVVEHNTPSYGRWVGFERNCDPASPPNPRNSVKTRIMALRDLCDHLLGDEGRSGAWLRRGFSVIAAEALNRSLLPTRELAFALGVYGSAIVGAVFTESGVALTAEAQRRLDAAEQACREARRQREEPPADVEPH